MIYKTLCTLQRAEAGERVAAGRRLQDFLAGINRGDVMIGNDPMAPSTYPYRKYMLDGHLHSNIILFYLLF